MGGKQTLRQIHWTRSTRPSNASPSSVASRSCVIGRRSREGHSMVVIARTALAAAAIGFVSSAALAQDATKVDPKHYKVITENAQVRVLRIHYGPHETSVSHSHPDSVVTYLTDGNIKFV